MISSKIKCFKNCDPVRFDLMSENLIALALKKTKDMNPKSFLGDHYNDCMKDLREIIKAYIVIEYPELLHEMKFPKERLNELEQEAMQFYESKGYSFDRGDGSGNNNDKNDSKPDGMK